MVGWQVPVGSSHESTKQHSDRASVCCGHLDTCQAACCTMKGKPVHCGMAFLAIQIQ